MWRSWRHFFTHQGVSDKERDSLTPAFPTLSSQGVRPQSFAPGPQEPFQLLEVRHNRWRQRSPCGMPDVASLRLGREMGRWLYHPPGSKPSYRKELVPH